MTEVECGCESKETKKCEQKTGCQFSGLMFSCIKSLGAIVKEGKEDPTVDKLPFKPKEGYFYYNVTTGAVYMYINDPTTTSTNGWVKFQGAV
jgi:hypothetical protein